MMKFSPHNDLTKYLPNARQTQQRKKESLQINFSTIQQISKSLKIQKANFDQQIHVSNLLFKSLNQRIFSCNNQLNRARSSNKELTQKISEFNFNIERSLHSEDSIFDQGSPKISLNQIFYDIKERPNFQKVTQKEELFYLENQIQRVEKECAKLFCLQTDKFQSFSLDLTLEFDKLDNRVISLKQNEKEKKSQIKIIMQQQTLKAKIKSWQKSLNQKFSTKMLRLIQKVQNQM